MSVHSEPQPRQEDLISVIWKAWGLILGGVAFLLLSINGLLRGTDPVVPIAQGAGAFISIWVLNRVFAVLLGLNDVRQEATHEKKSE